MIESMSDPQVWIALGTLTFLEIVLGVDNIIFISILSGKLPQNQQAKARRLGLLAAMLGARGVPRSFAEFILGDVVFHFLVLSPDRAS